jgi:hypothetical protein
MTEPKSVWHKPEMIAVVRARPEEAVLAGCKLFPALGPSHGFDGCYQTPGPSGLCTTYCDQPQVS